MLLLIAGFPGLSRAQQVVLSQTQADGVYAADQPVRMVVHLPSTAPTPIQVTVWKNFGSHISSRTLTYTGDSLVVFDQRLAAPATVLVSVHALGDSVSQGAVVAPQLFKPGTPRPKDLDAYWKLQKKLLHRLPWKVQMDQIQIPDSSMVCYNTELNCLGPKPARGYFAKPRHAGRHSLPIVIYLHAAGNINASWVKAQPGNALRYAAMGKGALSFDLNAHGMRNGEPDAYYDSLQRGPLQDYPHIGMDQRRTFYFRGMYLRLLRTLDFLARQPEWDGKRILLVGESQGGGQALAGAGLDHRVTAVVATVPAMCDWGATLQGRKGGWPDPFASSQVPRDRLMQVLPYFDNAHLLKGCRATLMVEIGLIDTTCPCSAVFAAVNQAKGTKILLADPYRPHQVAMMDPLELNQWKRTRDAVKNAFILNYLK